MGCRSHGRLSLLFPFLFSWEEPQQTAAQRALPYDVEMNMPHRKGVAEKCLFCRA